MPISADPAEVERLRAERDAAIAALDKQRTTRVRGGVVRRTGVGVLVVLFALLVPVTAAAAWVDRTVLDTDSYVDRVAPIAADPDVVDALSRRITAQLYLALDPEKRIAAALPPDAALTSTPVARGRRVHAHPRPSRSRQATHLIGTLVSSRTTTLVSAWR